MSILTFTQKSDAPAEEASVPAGGLVFEAETLERFERTWTLPRAEETLICETVIDCTETEECETVGICSIEDCTGCDNSCSCVV